MAYEIDQDEDQKSAPVASAPQAPAAAASATPAPQAPSAPAGGGSRFVGFDQLLQMNRPSAEATAGSLASQANQKFDAASEALNQSASTFKNDVQAGVTDRGYQGPQAGQFDVSSAQNLARDGQQYAQALNTPGGVQALLQRQGQTADAARYNALFATTVGQPQFQAAADRFKDFDGLVGQARTGAQEAVAKGQTDASVAIAQRNNAEQVQKVNEVMGSRKSHDDLQARYDKWEPANRDIIARLKPADRQRFIDEKLGAGSYERLFGGKP